MQGNIVRAIDSLRASKALKSYSSAICPDQVVAQLEYNNSKIQFTELCRTKSNKEQKCENSIDIFDRRDLTKESKLNNNLIVLVLESPHKDEYDQDSKAIGPAYGISGNNINKFLPSILMDAINQNVLNMKCGLYDVVLVNAVQKQCSLGEIPKLYRDVMFLREWEQQCVREDFSARLQAILSNLGDKNYIIINCCTQGYHDRIDGLIKHRGGITKKYIDEIEIEIPNTKSYRLNDLVSDMMRILGVKFYTCSHPSSWNIHRILRNV